MKEIQMKEAEISALARALRGVDFFSSLTVADLDRVMRHVQLMEFSVGEYVFKQGAAGDAFFIVHEGNLSVWKRKLFFLPATQIGELKTGQFFGEMALLDRAARSASVKAETASKLFVLFVSAFDMISSQNPAFGEEMKKISEQRKFQNVRWS